jgi:hypothetical protein
MNREVLPMLALTTRGTRALVVGSALAVSLLLGPLSSLSAHAALTYCRTDPVVLLSNGQTVQLEADIADSVSDVQHVDYLLHAPAGTSVVSVVYSGDVPANQESFEFTADGGPNGYHTATTVTTGASNVTVTATTTLPGADTDSTQGQSGQTLHCHVKFS